MRWLLYWESKCNNFTKNSLQHRHMPPRPFWSEYCLSWKHSDDPLGPNIFGNADWMVLLLSSPALESTFAFFISILYALKAFYGIVNCRWSDNLMDKSLFKIYIYASLVDIRATNWDILCDRNCAVSRFLFSLL